MCRRIVVCGHSHCGAIRALYEEVPPAAQNLVRWLDLGREAVLPVAEPGPDVLRRTEQRAIVLQLERLMDYPMVRERVEAGALTLHGWHYVIEEGEVHVFDVQRGGFVPASQADNAGTGPYKLQDPACRSMPVTCRRPVPDDRGRHSIVMTRPTIRIAPATQIDGGPRPATAPPKAALRALLRAPHRLAFFAGGVMLLLTSFAWVVWLLLSAAGVSVITALPPTLAHGFAFAAAYMPLFIAGFMFTAGPRWLDVPTPPANVLIWPVRLHVAGIVLVLVGTVVSPGTAAFGSLLLAIAWTAIGVAFATLVRSSRVT